MRNLGAANFSGLTSKRSYYLYVLLEQCLSNLRFGLIDFSARHFHNPAGALPSSCARARSYDAALELVRSVSIGSRPHFAF